MTPISPSGLTHIASADVRNRISIAVAREALDVAESRGEAMVDMIRSAGDVGRSALRIGPRSGHAPISASPVVGETGGRLDVTG